MQKYLTGSSLRQWEVDAAAAFLLAGFVAAVFAPVVGFDFLRWDDNRILAELDQRGGDVSSRLNWAAQSHGTFLLSPVSMLSWGLLADIFDVVPKVFHAASLCLHVLNALLLYWLIRRLLDEWHPMQPDGRPDLALPLTAFACAGGWALHPLRAEVVAWVAAFPYVLSTALALSATHLFLAARRIGGSRMGLYLTAAVGFYAMSVLAHPQSVPVCVALLALDWFLNHTAASQSQAARRRHCLIGFHFASFCLAAAGVAAGIWVRSQTPGMQFVVPSDLGDATRLLTELTKFIGFSVDFGIFHAWLPLQTRLTYGGYWLANWQSPAFVLGTLAFATLCAFAVRQWKRQSPGLLAAVTVHMAFCLPAAGLFVDQYMPADRYLYGIACSTAVHFAFVFTAWLGRPVRLPAWSPEARRASILLPIGTGLVIASALTTSALRSWRDTPALMEHLQVTAINPGWNLFAKMWLVDYWSERDNPPEATKALLSALDAPTERKEQRAIQAIGYFAAQARCAEAAFLGKHAMASLSPQSRKQVQTLLDACGRPGE